MEPYEADAAGEEAARLRYELARLRDRRTVRAALAIGDLRRSGVRAAVAALRGRAPRLDVPGPDAVPLRAPFPQLRVLYTGDGHLLRSTCVHARITPSTATALLRRDRPDLVLVDGVTGWSTPDLQALGRACREADVPLVTVGAAASVAVDAPDLRVALEVPAPGADLHLGAVVDLRAWSPAGLDSSAPAHRCDDPSTVDATAARRQPVVVVPEVAAVGVRRCLELLAAGAVVVAGPSDGLREALGPVADQVVGPVDTVEERAAARLADDEGRHRASVRLRRHVQAHRSTRDALITLVEALQIDARPSPRISVLLATRRPDRVRQVVADLAAQAHPDVEVIVLPHGQAAPSDDLPGVVRVQPVSGDRPFGAVLNVGLDLATGEYIAKVDDDDRYGPHHLGDQVLALHHSGASMVGRRSHGVYDERADVTVQPLPDGEERFEDHLPGGTLLLPTALLRAVRWRHVPRAVDTELVRAVHLAGGSAYSGHRYGYVRVRHGDHLYDPEVDWTGARTAGFDAGLLDA